MKILKFSFKNEAIWMVALSLTPLVLMLLLLLILGLMRLAR